MQASLRTIPGFDKFIPRIGMLVRRTPTNFKELASIAQELHATYCQASTFNELVNTYLSLCYAIDQAKVRAIGINAPTGVANHLQRALAFCIAETCVVEWRKLDELERLRKELSQHPDNLQRWLSVKAQILHWALLEVRRVHWCVNNMQFRGDSEIHDFLNSQVSVIDQYIADLMGKLRQIRKYGIKPSYFRLPSLPIADGSWVFWGFRDFMWKGSGYKQDSYVAQVALATQKELRDLRLIRHEVDDGGKVDINSVELPFDAYFCWSMNWEGEIDLTTGLDLSLVRKIFERVNKSIEYHAIRYHLAMCLYDLIAPLTVVQTVPEIVGKAMPVVARVLTRQPNIAKVLSQIGQLIVPRLLTLDDLSQVMPELEQEVAEGE